MPGEKLSSGERGGKQTATIIKIYAGVCAGEGGKYSEQWDKAQKDVGLGLLLEELEVAEVRVHEESKTLEQTLKLNKVEKIKLMGS